MDSLLDFLILVLLISWVWADTPNCIVINKVPYCIEGVIKLHPLSTKEKGEE